MTPGRFCLIAAVALAAPLAAAAAPPAMNAGAWLRSTTFELNGSAAKFPLLSKGLGIPMKSTVCISAEVARRGPLAIVLAGDEQDCHLASAAISNGDFTAKRTCPADKGGEDVFDMSARFTPDSIKMTSAIHSAHGGQATAHSELRRVGPCRADTPPPG